MKQASMIDYIEQLNEDDSAETLIRDHGKTYRPRDAKWDDDIDPHLIVHHDIDLIGEPYDSNAVRKCFACMVNRCVKGSIYCLSCAYKRNRRINAK